MPVEEGAIHDPKQKVLNVRLANARVMPWLEFKTKVRAMAIEDELNHDPDFEQMPEYFYIKHLIAACVRPQTIVEIGVKGGLGAWAMLSACSWPVRYTGYDGYDSLADVPPEWKTGRFKHLVPKRLDPLGVDYSLLEFDTQKLNEFPVADLYHIDGCHRSEGVRRDLNHCWISGGPDSAFLVDDVMCGRDVIRGVHAFIADRGLALPIFYKSLRGEALFFRNGDPPLWAYQLQRAYPQRTCR